MADLRWYQKQMTRQDISTAEYMRLWNISRELEANSHKVQAEAETRRAANEERRYLESV